MKATCEQWLSGKSFVPRMVVLVVEDEFLVRVVALTHVEDAGFEVIEAANAEQAIIILDRATISGLCSRMLTCPAQWMARCLRLPFVTVGVN